MKVVDKNFKEVERNKGIDFLRLCFAFCVVALHVQLYGAIAIYPFLRCAVPFFYLVTGFFLYNHNADILNNKLKINIIKWIKLYIKYILSISIISIILHIYLNQPININILDIAKELFLGIIPENLNAIEFNSTSIGLFTTWFLLSGAYALLILYLLQRWLFKKYLLICIGIIYMIGIIVNLSDLIFLPKYITMSTPYLLLGLWIGKYRNKLPIQITHPLTIIFVVLLSYGEFIIYNKYGIISENYFTSPILSSIIFISSLKRRKYNRFVCFLSEIGNKLTLFVYVYHRVISALLLVFVYNFYQIQAIVVFLLSLIIGYLYQAINNKIKIKR